MSQPVPFGKYILLERVNVGGMAEVFKAKAFGIEEFQRMVAIKKILPSIAEDKEFITMFIDEAKIAVQLSHANIAQIFDLGKVDDAYYIAMEFVRGKDLRVIFERARDKGKPVATALACYSVMKICEGLDYAHNKRDSAGRELGLIHRDVSPQNVLVSYDGGIKIIDFGVAKAANKAGQTQAGILKGKFGYMSPEQVRGMPIDRRSDIFAVGIVLFELLTGQRLFSAETDFATLEKVRNVEITNPRTFNKEVPEELEQIVLKALAKDVADRYQTAMDLHDDLQSFLYTSGHRFGRKDLARYMKEAFAPEIESELARDEVHALVQGPQPSPSTDDAFDSLPTAIASTSMPPRAIPPGQHAQSAPPPIPPTASSPSHRKPTLMGIGIASAPPTAPSTAPGIPSNPPPIPPSASNPSIPAGAAPTGAVPVDWDEEELATSVYDKPGDSSPMNAMAAGIRQQASARQANVRASQPPISQSPLHGNTAQTSPEIPSQTPALAPAELIVPQNGSNPAISAANSAHSQGLQTATPPGGHSVSNRPSETVPLATANNPKKKSSALFMVMSALLVVVAVLLGYLAWTLIGPKKRARIELRVEDPDAIVTLDDKEIAGNGSYLIQNVEPGIPHMLKVEKTGYESWVLKLDPLDPGEHFSPTHPVVLRPEKTTPTLPEQGIQVRTEPKGASVYIDGQKLDGSTPLIATNIPTGVHEVRVVRVGFRPWISKVTINKDTEKLPTVAMAPGVADVIFQSDPAGASAVLIRGDKRQPVGELTPTTSKVDLSQGDWQVEFSRNGYKPLITKLEIPYGSLVATVRAKLERSSRAEADVTRDSGRDEATKVKSSSEGSVETKVSTRKSGSATKPAGGRSNATKDDDKPEASGKGTIDIGSSPWAYVYVDGKKRGTTPLRGLELSAGSHQVKLENPELKLSKTFSIKIVANKRSKKIVRLQQ